MKRGLLAGKTVLITRPRAQSAALSQPLRALGARVIEFPVIQILPPKNWRALDCALQKLDRFDWVIFTSPNGVRFVLDRASSENFSGVKIAAIGEATARELRSRKLRVHLCPGQFTSRALLEALKKKKEIRGRRFFLPRTDIAPEELRRNLIRSGASVTQVTAYRTLPLRKSSEIRKIERLLALKKVDYVVFASASAVRCFFQALAKSRDKMGGVKWISIGPVTTGALREQRQKVFGEAKPHTIQGIVRGIIRAEKNGH